VWPVAGALELLTTGRGGEDGHVERGEVFEEGGLHAASPKAVHWVTWERDGLVGTIRPDQLDQAMRRRAAADVRAARRTSKRRLSDEMLEEVAQVYRSNVTNKPTQAVADHFGKAHRTAGLYVSRAREAGLLGRAHPGKAGEVE
jgi:hypothetical protein